MTVSNLVVLLICLVIDPVFEYSQWLDVLAQALLAAAQPGLGTSSSSGASPRGIAIMGSGITGATAAPISSRRIAQSLGLLLS